jgi:hypothetical protein
MEVESINKCRSAVEKQRKFGIDAGCQNIDNDNYDDEEDEDDDDDGNISANVTVTKK